jgi:hypothetical protein
MLASSLMTKSTQVIVAANVVVSGGAPGRVPISETHSPL